MLSFSTEFPIEHSKQSKDFSDAVREWVLGSHHTKIKSLNLINLGESGEWSFQQGTETIESLSSRTQDGDSVAIRYKKTDGDLEWITSLVFSKQQSSSWVSVRITCESLHPAARLPSAKKPVLIRVLLNKLGGGSDGSLPVSNTPFILNGSDIEFAADCIMGRTGSRLPIIYISAQFGGGHIIDIKELATELSGMGHVIVEPDRPFSVRLMDEVQSQNVYGGTIGIYWPDGGGRRSFFVGKELESSGDIRRAIFEEIRLALNNRRPLYRCTWAAVTESHSRQIINQLKETGSTEIDKYVTAFDDELNAKTEELREAENEIQRLNAELRRHETKIPMRSGLSISTGKERDLYPGEILGIARDAFSDYLSKVPVDSRRQHILTALYEQNEPAIRGADFREQLKSLLRDYKSMDARTRKTLEDMGFGISDDGKHFKLVFQGDSRYSFTLSKTGSDHRGGLNAATDISRLLF